MQSTKHIQELSQELISILHSGQHIRILSHRNPDADAIGSMVAFASVCEHFKLSYDLMGVDPVPNNLMFMMEGLDFQIVDPEKLDEVQNEQTDIVAFLDCGQLNRAGNFSEIILPHQKLINIDHHMSNTMFGDFNCVEDISSTCELLYNIIDALGVPMTNKLATALYVGVLTDTGMFQYEKITADSHRVIAELFEYGVDHFHIYRHIYQDNPISWLSLLKNALNKIEFFEDNKLAMICLTLDELQQCDDVHILFPIIMSTREIEVCIILKEKEDDSISASLRSKEAVNVAHIAQTFGGGGHIKASGCRSTKYSLSEFKELLYNETTKHLQ